MQVSWGNEGAVGGRHTHQGILGLNSASQVGNRDVACQRDVIEGFPVDENVADSDGAELVDSRVLVAVRRVGRRGI